MSYTMTLNSQCFLDCPTETSIPIPDKGTKKAVGIYAFCT